MAFSALSLSVQAQEDPVGKIRLDEGLSYKVEMQGSLSDSKTPLWLNANRYGLSSLEKENGYQQADCPASLR